MNSDNLYHRGSAVYSPSLSPADAVGCEIVTPADRIGFANHDEAIPVVPKPPSPSVGGQTGIARALGWTVGLLPHRTMRQRFTGKVLVVPNQGPHPVVGEVGRSNRTGRLAANVDALTRDYLPPPDVIAASFTRPNPLGDHMEDVYQS